jgi:hypothetical protein
VPIHAAAPPWGSLVILGGLACLAWRLGTGLSFPTGPGEARRARRFIRRGERASALFDFVLTFPLFLMIVLIIVQMALMINARLVVGWAAFAAARSAVVSSEGGIDAARREAEAAAAIGTLPIAPSSPLHELPDLRVLPLLIAGNENPELPGSQMGRRWLRTAGKLGGARALTDVEISGADRYGRFSPRSPVTVTVLHRYQLRVPWAGGALAALVGRRGLYGPEVVIDETVTLVNQGRIHTEGTPPKRCPDPAGNFVDWLLGMLS